MKKFDFRWQRRWLFDEPHVLASGTLAPAVPEPADSAFPVLAMHGTPIDEIIATVQTLRANGIGVILDGGEERSVYPPFASVSDGSDG